MQLSQEIFTAPADSIDDSGPHLFWSSPADRSLIDSICEFGQTTPVLARETDTGLHLVAGYARLDALRQRKQPTMVRLVLDADASSLGLLYLADNAHRAMDDGMRLKALLYFRPLMDDSALKKNILPRLGIKIKSKDAKLLIAWLDMPEEWQALLVSGTMPLAAVTPLGHMSADDQSAVQPLFTDFSWSRSNAVNVLTWLFETSRMTDTPVGDIMRQAGMNDILQQGLSPKDAIARLCTAAKTARYPKLNSLQEAFTKSAAEITAETRWRLTQPNNFETGGAELTIQVKDESQLHKAVQELESMARASTWKKVWGLGSTNE